MVLLTKFRPRFAAVVATALALVLVCPAVIRAAELSCTVKYLSAEHVYLDAGSNRGLEVGMKGRIVRAGAAIGEVEIVFVAETSASCTVSSKLEEFVAGDDVVFDVAGEAAEVTPVPVPVVPRARTRPTENGNRAAGSKGMPRFRGSVAIQWDHGEETNDRKLQTDTYRLPFRFEAQNLWQGFMFRTRGSLRRIERQGFSASTPASEWRNRIQEVAFIRAGRELDWHIAVGRIGSHSTNTAGPFDGLSLSRRITANARLGVFGGFAPEWGSLGFGTEDHVVGADLHYNRRRDDGRLLDFVLAGIGRYRSGEISREYVTLTTTWRGTQGLSLLQAAEIDFNRGWRADAGARSVVLSSVALTGRYDFNRKLGVDLGFDNRDPVRTWETRSLPDSLFQDSGRKGWRAGVHSRPFGRAMLNLSGSLRKDDNSDKNITSWTARATVPGVISNHITVFGGLSGFDGPWLSGFAPSLGVSGSTRAGLGWRCEAGSYRYTGAIDNSTRKNRWASLGLDKDLTARMSAAVEYRQDWGDDIVGRRWFLELRHRF